MNSFSSKINFSHVTIFLTALSYIAFSFLLFSEDFKQLHQLWTTPSELTHGYLALLVAWYLMIRNGGKYTVKPEFFWLIPLALLMGSYFLGAFLEIKTLKHLSLLTAFPTFICLVFGKVSLRFTIIPTLLIGMALPLTYLAIPLLQKMTVITNTFLIKQAEWTVFIEGAHVQLTTGTIWIKDGCSGHKYFTTAITLALIMIGLDRYRKPQSLAIFGIALALSLVSNWIRVFIVIMVAYRSSVNHPLVLDHDNFGWLVFGIAMIPLFLYWRRCTPLPEEIAASKNTEPEPAPIKVIAYGMAGLLTMTLPGVLSNQLIQKQEITYPPFQISEELNQYKAVPANKVIWKPSYKGADYLLLYSNSTQGHHLAISQYNWQGKAKELDNSENLIFDKTWRKLDKSSISINPDNGRKFKIIKEIARHPSHGTYAVLYWHIINGRAVSPGIKSKLQMLSNIGGSSRPDLLVALARPCESDCKNSGRLLTEEINKLLPYIAR